jgi:hypothetical protein
MHATAQPWHAEGLPLPTGALRRLQSPSAWQLTLSIEQQPYKQLLDAQGFSEQPNRVPKPQTFSHSFSHPRQPDSQKQIQQQFWAYTNRVF